MIRQQRGTPSRTVSGGNDVQTLQNELQYLQKFFSQFQLQQFRLLIQALQAGTGIVRNAFTPPVKARTISLDVCSGTDDKISPQHSLSKKKQASKLVAEYIPG